MNEDNKKELLHRIYNLVFNWFDTEPDYTGMDAGKIATLIEQASKKVIENYHNEN